MESGKYAIRKCRKLDFNYTVIVRIKSYWQRSSRGNFAIIVAARGYMPYIL